MSMSNIVFRDTLIGGYLAVKGLSVINKQSKTITVIKKWQQLWVVVGQSNTAQWVLAIYHDRNNWMHSQKPLTVYQFVQLHSFTDKQTYDGLHMFLLKFAGGHKISFACGTQKQKSEWLTAVQKALNACYNKKQQKESHRSVTDDDWWQLSEHQDNNTPEFKEFQVVLSSCSLPGNINRCRVCLFPNQSCIEVYGYSTYSSYTVKWTWQYSQLYCISFDKETLTLTVQLYISDQLEEICWTGNEALHLYNSLCNVSGVWDCTAQMSEATVDDISPTIVRLEESDYTSVGVILPDYLVQQMEDWYLVELVYYQHRPQLLGQYEVQLSLTHLHLKGCNSPHCWSWELHHIKSYSLDTDQYLIIEVEGTSDVWSGVFHFGDIGAYNGHITTLYQLLQQLMVKLYLVVMIKQQLIVTRKQLSVLMNSDQSLHSMIECFSCELLEGPSQDLLGHYTLQIFIDQIRVISNNAKWVWLLTELYSYKLDQEEVGGATYVTIQISNSGSAVIEDWVWSGNHMIRFYSFLLELCQLLSQQSCQEILIRQVVTIRLMTSQIVTINTYTIQLTKDDLMLIDADSQQVICSYPLECIKRLNLDEGTNELIICTSESTTLQPSELIIAADNAQELTLLINEAVQNKQQSLNDQVMTCGSSLDSHQSQIAQLPSNYMEIAHQVSYKQASTESQEAEYQTPTKIPAQHSAQHHLISAHQIPADNQQVPVKTMHRHPVKTNHTLTDTIHKTNWNISHQQQQSHSVGPITQEMIKTCEIKHQISANADNQVTPYLAEAQQQVLTEVHKIEYHSTSGFQQIQDNVCQPLHERQLPSHEVIGSKQLKPQETPEQPHTQIQHTLLKSQQAYSEIAQVPHEGTNTVPLDETHKVSHVLDITPIQTGEISQAVQQISRQSQQVSTENETTSQPSVEAQLLQLPNHIAYEPPVKLDEAKEVTHEIQHVVTEVEEEQEYTLTECRHVMQQISADTPVSVVTQQNLEPRLYTPQPLVEQSVTVDTLQKPQFNTQTNSQKIIDNEQQGENKQQFPLTARQTPIVFDQTTFQTPGEAYDEPMEQTQHVSMPSMETIETIHQYTNTKETSNDKQGPTEISQVPNESTNTILLLETQNVSHLLNTPTDPKEMPQADPQQTDTRSGDICSTETMQQPLNKNTDKLQVTQCIVNENANEPIELHRKPPDVEQAVTQHLLPDTMHCGKRLTEFQPQSQNQQLVEAPREPLQVTEVIHPHDMVTETQEIVPHKTVEELAQEAQVVTCQVSNTIWQQVSPEIEEDIIKLVKSQHTNEVAKSTQAFVMVDATSTKSVIPRSPNIQTFTDTQEIFVGPDKMSQQLPADHEILEVMSDQPQNFYQDPAELTSDEVHDVKRSKLLVEVGGEVLQEHPQAHNMSGKTQEFMHISSGQPQPEITTMQTSVEIQKVEHQEQVLIEPHKFLEQLAVKTEQQMISKSVDNVPTEPALNKCAQTMYEHTITEPQNTSPKLHEAKEIPQCSIIANALQLLNDSPHEMMPHPLEDVCSSSPQRQPLLAPNDEDGQQGITESDKVSRQFMDDDHKVVMTETHHCITLTDAPAMSCEAGITCQSSILQVMPDNLKKILYQTHEWCSSETQHISDSTPQPVILTEQTLPNTNQPVTDERQCVEVEMLCTSKEKSNQQFPKTAQELNEPQSVIMHEVVMDRMPTSVDHVVQHPPSEETPAETYHEPQMKSSNTQEPSDEAAEQIIRQPVEKDYAQTTTNIQGSSGKTHDGVKDDQVALAIQSTPDTIYTTMCQLAPTSMFEPQKTSLQQPLRQIMLEKLEKLQTEALLDEDNVDVAQPITLETEQEIPPSSQQALFTTKVTHHEIQQTLNTVEPSQLLIDMQEQTQNNEPQQITYQLPEAVEEHHKPFETECTSVKTPEIVNQIPVGTTPQIQSTSTHQEASLDNHQMMSIEKSPLGINDDIKEAAEIPTKTKEVKQCFKFNNNQISHKTSPFSVEVHELSIKDDSISCQPMAKTQQPALNKPQFQTQQMADKKTCPLLLEAQQSVLHEISIDYREKTVETRKTFYKTSAPDYPHTFERLFSIGAKQPLSSEQLQPQQIPFKTQESTHRALDEPQPTLAESEHLEKEQISVETQLHVPNKEILNETQEVVRTVEILADKEKTQQIIPPVETITAQELHTDNMPVAKKYTSPLVVEYDEDVMIIDFTNSDHVTKHGFIIAPSDHVCYHHQLYADEDVTSTGEEISTCTIHCCSYHILVKIEKVPQKKQFNEVSISNRSQHQYDLLSTRKAIDELLLKYM